MKARTFGLVLWASSLPKMAESLLKVRYSIPPVRPDLVHRPRLFRLLDESLHRKLVLVSAPAGYGKTTLLSAWAKQGQPSVGWLSLDEGLNDPARFLSHLIAATQTLQPGAGEEPLAGLAAVDPHGGSRRHPLSLPAIESILAAVINSLAERSSPGTLVLDDYHLIDSTTVHRAVGFLLDHLPPSLHLVVATRADPPLPLSRLRGRNELLEVRARDLAFTVEEATSFLNGVMGLRLGQEDIAALGTRTEGWAVGLQMAALSLQGEKNARDFVRAFTGSHRYILDYLVGEVLARQDEMIQEFLLKTSPLDRMTVSLCEAVVGRQGAQSVLDSLEQANLFLVPLDEERRWFRYHHLFAELLRNRLAQFYPKEVPQLHLRASRWYEEHGYPMDAVQHARQAGDLERVTALIEAYAPEMMMHGDLATLNEWLDMLPAEVVRARPWLCVHHARVHVYGGREDEAELLLARAEEGVPQAGDEREQRRLRAHIAAARCYLRSLHGDAEGVRVWAGEALQNLPEEDALLRSFCLRALGYALRLENDFPGAAQALADAVAVARRSSDPFDDVRALCELAFLEMERGRLRAAARACEDALQSAKEYVRRTGTPVPVAAQAEFILGEISAERGDVDAALCHFQDGFRLCGTWGESSLLVDGYLSLAEIRLTAGDLAGAMQAVGKARAAGPDLPSTYQHYIGAYEAPIHLARGDLAVASRWAAESGLEVEDEVAVRLKRVGIAFADVLVAQGRKGEAMRLCERMLAVTEAAGAMGYVAPLLAREALILHAQGRSEEAFEKLSRAMALAEPENRLGVFIRLGGNLAGLLRSVAARGCAVEFVERLLAAIESRSASGGRPGPAESLSDRELEVLRLVAVGLSNRQIASHLVLSEATVKKHVNNIYAKLSAHKRTEAVALARELGLL
jgi:LuxR family maltose regulon positive regulatory protein